MDEYDQDKSNYTTKGPSNYIKAVDATTAPRQVKLSFKWWVDILSESGNQKRVRWQLSIYNVLDGEWQHCHATQ